MVGSVMVRDDTIQLIRDHLDALRTGQRDTLVRLQKIEDKVTEANKQLAYTNGKVTRNAQDISYLGAGVEVLKNDFDKHKVKMGEKGFFRNAWLVFMRYVLPPLITAAVVVMGYSSLT